MTKLREAIIEILGEFPSHPIVQTKCAPEYADRIITAVNANLAAYLDERRGSLMRRLREHADSTDRAEIVYEAADALEAQDKQLENAARLLLANAENMIEQAERIAELVNTLRTASDALHEASHNLPDGPVWEQIERAWHACERAIENLPQEKNDG